MNAFASASVGSYETISGALGAGALTCASTVSFLAGAGAMATSAVGFLTVRLPLRLLLL